MPLKEKEKKQIMMLVGLMAVIFMALGYYYRDRLLPQPQAGGASYTPPQRLELPNFKTAQDVFKRDDYQGLRQFGSVPVKAAPAGSINPFK